MNKEFKNIWKFVKSEELGIGRMALSMAKGLNEMDNTNYQQWYWFFISATMQGREADADNCLKVYNDYAKELLG